MAFYRPRVVFGGLALALCVGSLSSDRTSANASGDRTISFYHIHTQERLTVTYKKGGQFVPEALKQINWLMRDWRKNEVIAIDPNTIDLAWEMHEELGSREPINVICGFRSRGTNELLRRTVGGQASQSQHITGKAIDITFPDVPLKNMRYSALIRERGGVGYYPTSGIPFVHIDTARVRSWPRLPRFELALLFPNGRSQHLPAEGSPITPSDVKVARTKHYELSIQIAQFLTDRRAPRPADATVVASAAPVTQPRPAAQAAPQPRFAVASLTPQEQQPAAPRPFNLTWEPVARATPPKPEAPPKQVAALTPASTPKLVAEPKLIDRSSRFTQAPKADRTKLAALAADAASMPMPQLLAGPKPAVRPQKALAAAATAEQPRQQTAAATQVAALMPDPSATPTSITDMSPDTPGNGWVPAPPFDEDHPEELAYRPFPLVPLLTDTDSPHDPQLAGLQHPDVAATLDVLDDIGGIVPMKFRPGQQVAQVMWAQQFQGKAVHLDALKEIESSRLPQGLEERTVKTSAR